LIARIRRDIVAPGAATLFEFRHRWWVIFDIFAVAF